MGVDAGMKFLRPPPRAVPWMLRVQLLTHRGVVIGAWVFGVASALVVALILAANPVGVWRLAREVRQAPGQLVAVESLNYAEDNLPMYRCRFIFRTPDGRERRGVCYMRGQWMA